MWSVLLMRISGKHEVHTSFGLRRSSPSSSLTSWTADIGVASGVPVLLRKSVVPLARFHFAASPHLVSDPHLPTRRAMRSQKDDSSEKRRNGAPRQVMTTSIQAYPCGIGYSKLL